MRHQLRIPLLSKPADQRKALLRGLTTQLIKEGRVTTTKARAKALRNEAERMISLAKEGSLASRRRAIGYIYDKKLVHSLFDKAKERYGDRNQVYTVILYSIKNAIKSKNTTYSNLLSEQGHEDMAKILREL